MFFRTQLKSVGVGGAVDMQGRQLAFIGYLPCKAGDWVYTDGAVIFGNSKPKGAPVISDEPSGIPVLGDSDLSGEKELRGYFTTRGKFKKYNIKGDDWIVNGKKNYNHDSGEGNIIDAEITLDDNGKETGIYTVEKIIIAHAEDYSDILLYRYSNSYYFKTSRRLFFSTMDLDTTQLDDRDMVKTAYRGWQYITNSKLSYVDYIRNDDSIIRECKLIIRENGQTVKELNLSEIVSSIENDALLYVNLNVQKEFEEHLKSRAILSNFKILPNGEWQALIEIEIAAENIFLASISGKKVYFASEAVQSTFLLKVDSDGSIKKIAENNEFFPLWLVSDRSGIIVMKNPDSDWQPFTIDKTTFPYATYQMVSSTWSSEEGMLEVQYFTANIWDSRNLSSRPQYRTKLYANSGDFTFPVQDEFSAKFTPRSKQLSSSDFDGIYDKDNNQIIGEILPRITDSHKWNMSLATLKGDSYLFGIHKNTDSNISGKLYKIDRDGNIEQVGDGVKNFRLRELKKISKAKKK